LRIFKASQTNDARASVDQSPPIACALAEFSLCFSLRWRYNRRFRDNQKSIRLMNPQIRRFSMLLAVVCLTLGLSYCGQKGGLTRPEPSAFTTLSLASGK